MRDDASIQIPLRPILSEMQRGAIEFKSQIEPTQA